MPETGLIESANLPVVNAESDAPAPPWEIGEALVQHITYEIPVASARRNLPDVVTRSAPTYGRVSVIDRADSPVGPYREALLMVGCRVGMIPALYVVDAVVNSEAARDAIAAHWKYLPSVGEVNVERGDDSIISSFDVGDGLTVTLHSPTTDAAAVAIVRYDPLLVVQPSNGSGAASEIPCEHDVRQAWLSRSSALSYDGGSRRHPWIQLRSSNAITAVAAVEGQVIEAAAAIELPGG
ncbi:MAG: hypothetical protein OXN86_01595 [Chloroflexota bacterium]|nr:hypothetical protein [Chloroflexota bacterium]